MIKLKAILWSLVAIAVFLGVIFVRMSWKQYVATQSFKLDLARQSYFDQKNKQIPKLDTGQKRVVFVGDSRIAMWRDLPKLTDAQVINQGYGGDTTAAVWGRIDRDVLSLSPDMVVMEVGINDLKLLGLFPGQERNIIENCKKNLAQIVKKFSSRNVPVIVLTIFPFGKVEFPQKLFWDSSSVAAVNETNDFLKNLAVPGVTVLNCDNIFIRDGKPRYSLLLGGVHANSSGYQELNQALSAPMSKILGRGAPA